MNVSRITVPASPGRTIDQSGATQSFRPFDITHGGPLYKLEKRIETIKENAPLTKRRAVFGALLTWLPLFVLSAMQGRAFGHNVPVPFLRDFSTYTRFLLAIPLYLLAENIIGPRVIEAAEQFVRSRTVVEKDYKRFEEIIDSGLRLRDSNLAEVVLAIVAYVLSIVAFKETALLQITSWYGTHTDAGFSLTLAGWWLLGFCIPFYQFLVLRWLWRLFLWFQFLGRVRGLNLQLFPTHPDGAGGLGFIGETQRFFGILLFTFSLASMGVLANEVLYGKVPLRNFLPAIVTSAVVALIALVAPLAVFSGTLVRMKREGLEEYGALATAYTGMFHKKWIKGENPPQEELLGTGDLQSLADLGNSYAFIQKARFLPIDPMTLLHLFVACLLPVVPLLLTVVPLKDLLRLLFKVLM